jgi:hypothetical protein
MDKDEFLAYVDSASKVVAQVYSFKRSSDTTGIAKSKFWLLFSAGLMAAIFLILMYLSIMYDNSNLEITSYVIISTSFGIVVTLTMNECLRLSDNKFISFNLMVKKALDEHFSKIN